MIEKIQRATASSPEGARGLVKGVLACAFQNLAFMLPTSLLYFLVSDLVADTTGGRTAFYVCGCVVCFALIFLTTWFQYNGTFFTTYKESGVRRLNLAERLRKLPLSFFGKRDLADLTSTIMADCEVLEKTCSHYIPGLFGSLISTVLIALSLQVFDWRMALAALWVIPVSIAILLGSYKIQDNVQAKTMAVKMACADGIQEYIESIRDLKANSAENAYLDGLSEKIRAVEKQTISAELTNAVFVTSAAMVLKLGIASVALTGSVLLIRGSIDVLTLFLFLLVASRLYDPMQGALQNLAAVIAMRTNVARMNEILDYPVQTGSEELTNQGCDMVFDHVGFAYQSGETVLKDVSFTAKQGEVTSLVGPSGGGKTTLCNLIPRFYDVTGGKILIDGQDVRSVTLRSLREAIGVVQQDVYLFSGTVAENIAYGRPGATRAEIEEAARLAGADGFVRALKNGYDTYVGERGVKLSGGQKQRLAIARVFLKNPRILLLDEATSALDNESEILVGQSLDKLAKGRTTLTIAHRLTTIQNADRILVLGRDGIEEEGSHEALLAKQGVYYRLWNGLVSGETL